MLKLDAAGQRFRQLLHLIYDPAAEGRIGKEAFPLVGEVGGEVRDDGVASPGVMDAKAPVASAEVQAESVKTSTGRL